MRGSLLVPRAGRGAVLLQFPLKVLPCHLVKHHIKGLVEFVQSADDVRVYFGVSSALGFAQTPRGAAVLRLLQARESLGFIKIEMFVGNNALESQEILHLCHLAGWINDKPLAADEVHLREGKILHPALQVKRVDPYSQRAPRRVDQPQRSILEGQDFESGNLGPLGQRLSIVRNGSGHRIAYDYDELNVSRHRVDSLGSAVCHEVAGRLLHRDLSFQRGGHQLSAKRAREAN